MTGELKSGELLDARFRLESRIGAGGMGEVWRATQQGLERTVAIKILQAKFSGLPHLRRRFAREARAAARLGHESIASVYDFGADDQGRMYIVMEFVEGAQLASAIGMGLAVRDVVEVAVRLLHGLAHAHARGVVHRDLKPENILLAGARLPGVVGVPKIVDFGIATLASERKQSASDTDHGQVVGTPQYMSPEQASGVRDLSPRTDLYNVGLILYELLSGRLPFISKDPFEVMTMHVHEPLPRLVPRPGLEVPEELIAIVTRALEKSPEDRWSSAAEMRAALEPLLLRAIQDPSLQKIPQPDSAHDAHTDTMFEDTILDNQPVPGAPQHRGEAPPNLPFVGRASDRARLLRIAEECARLRRGRVVLLDGESGSGKTRLAMWLKENMEECGLFRGHIGVATRGGRDGWNAMRESIESLFRTRAMTREALVARIRRKCTSWGQDPDAWDVEALADFLRPQSAREGRARPVSELFATLARTLELACGQLPRLLILDDIQWADPELIDLIEYLAVELRHHDIPLVIIATLHVDELAAHPEIDRKLRAMSRYAGESVERMTVERMDLDDARELARAVLPVSDDVLEIVARRAEGNPMHLVVLLRYLRDEGALEQRGQLWHARDLEQVRDGVPPSLADLFQVRVRQIEARRGMDPDQLGDLITRCAVLGRRFSFEVLEAMIRLDGDAEGLTELDDCFDLLLDEGLLTEVVGRGEEWYMFSHGLMRDVWLTTLRQRQRRSLHRLAARALEEVYDTRLDVWAAEIAAHWSLARQPDEALGWFWRAAEAARRGFLTRPAREAYERALEIMDERLEAHPPRPGERPLHPERFELARVDRGRYLSALVHVGDLMEGEGSFDRAEEVYRAVIKLCGKPSAQLDLEVITPLIRAWLGLGHVSWQRGDFAAAQWAFERVAETSRQPQHSHDELRALHAGALRGLARIAWQRGDFEQASEWAEVAGDMAADVDDPDGQAEALWVRGEVARVQSHQHEAWQLFEESLALYGRAHSPTGIARNLLSMAQLARYHKDFARARDLYERALERYREVGDRRGIGLCVNGLGEIARFEGRLEDAYAHYLDALEVFERIGATYDIAVAYSNLGLIALRWRDIDSADRYLTAALSLGETDDMPYLVAGVEFNLALVKLLRGEDEQALSLITNASDLSTRIPTVDLDFAEPLEHMAQLSVERDNTTQARALWERARAIYAALDLRADLARVDEALAGLEG